MTKEELDKISEELNPNNPHGDTYEVGQYFGFQDGFEAGFEAGSEEALKRVCGWLKANTYSFRSDEFLEPLIEAMKG